MYRNKMFSLVIASRLASNAHGLAINKKSTTTCAQHPLAKHSARTYTALSDTGTWMVCHLYLAAIRSSITHDNIVKIHMHVTPCPGDHLAAYHDGLVFFTSTADTIATLFVPHWIMSACTVCNGRLIVPRRLARSIKHVQSIDSLPLVRKEVKHKILNPTCLTTHTSFSCTCPTWTERYVCLITV